MRRIAIAVFGCTFAAAVCLADGNVEQKTQVHFASRLLNWAGGQATHEGITSNTVVHGNRKLTTTGTAGEIVDLGEEKIYNLDYGRKTYKVTTFDELRKRFEDEKARAEKSEGRSTQQSEKNQGPEYVVDFDVKDTGEKQLINGFNTHQVIVTATTHEKGKTIDESGGVILTSDMWIGPRIAAMREIADFDRRYFEKLYGSGFGGADMAQMALLMATNPAFGKAMKAFSQKKSSLDGTPIKSILSVESVAAPGQQANGERESSPSLSPASAIGGLLRKAAQKRQDPNGSPNRSKLLESNVEVLKASASASASDVALPAGFREK